MTLIILLLYTQPINTFSKDNILTFADHLYAQEDYAAALNEYQRYQFLADSMRSDIPARIVDCLINLQRYDEALVKCNDIKDEVQREFTKGTVFFMAQQYDSSRTHLIDIREPYNKEANKIIGLSYAFEFRFQEAEEYLNHALNHMVEYDLENDDIYLSASELYALLGDFHTAEEYLKNYYDLQKVKEEEESFRKATWLIHKGFIELKKKNIYESENNLTEGIRISRETNHVPVLLQGLIYLIELLITKYKTEEDSLRKQGIFEEIELSSEECVILFREYKSVFQMVNYQLLLVTVYILMYKIELASSILERTINICKEFELEQQLKAAESKLAVVQKLSSISKVDDLKEETDKLTTTLENAMMGYSSKGVKEETHISEIDDEQKLIYLLVILPSGLPCYSFIFKETDIHEDELLVAGLIDAIQKFSSTISQKKGVFRMLEHSDCIILLESREEYTVALFTENFSYDLKNKLIEFANKVVKSIEIFEQQDFIQKSKLDKIKAELNEAVKEIFSQVSQIKH